MVRMGITFLENEDVVLLVLSGGLDGRFLHSKTKNKSAHPFDDWRPICSKLNTVDIQNYLKINI